jgi:hypothetical protein
MSVCDSEGVYECVYASACVYECVCVERGINELVRLC